MKVECVCIYQAIKKYIIGHCCMLLSKLTLHCVCVCVYSRYRARGLKSNSVLFLHAITGDDVVGS
jgi:hypothetical protein